MNANIEPAYAGDQLQRAKQEAQVYLSATNIEVKGWKEVKMAVD